MKLVGVTLMTPMSGFEAPRSKLRGIFTVRNRTNFIYAR
jgi:hypothetical protein